MINIVRGASTKPVSSSRLIQYLESRTDLEGTLYLGYPIIGTIEGAFEIDALLVTKQQGVVVFDIVEGPVPSDRSDIQDNAFTKIQAKFLQNKSLINKRNLMVEVGVVTYAPAWKNYKQGDEEEAVVITDNEELNEFLEEQRWPYQEYYTKLVAAIQAITTIKARPKREKVTRDDSRGFILKGLEESIANLDSFQSEAVIETADGPQRIRGLAGSGKTIILALKVAYLHAKNPDWNIAVTFNTRSLKNQFYDLIKRFTYEQKHEEPDWTKIKIIHAWGSPNMDGVYYQICKAHGVEFIDFNTARLKAPRNEFDYVCEEALKQIQSYEEKYDAILIDEAQDFSKSFLKLCYNFLKKPKRLIYAYDELQSLNKLSMDTPENIFGADKKGKPLVQLSNLDNQPKEDIILKKCYRNSKPVLVTAHALGFGVYREDGLIQMFEQSSLWKDIGYKVDEGELKDDSEVVLVRTDETSPRFLESHSPIDDLLNFKTFDENNEQIRWIAKQIKKNLEQDELEFEDIMVINCDPITTKTDVAPLRQLLFDMGINSHLAGVSTPPDEFFQPNSVTFTSIFRAKGNEAAMVYVMNAQDCYKGMELSKKRNILFTAITRSKAWVRITGWGNHMEGLSKEFDKVKDNQFKLKFNYPNSEERKKMNVVNRDMTKDEKQEIKTQVSNVENLLNLLKRGKIHKEDLPDDLLDGLKELFDK